MSTTEVSELLAACRAREIGLDDVADRFRRRSWPMRAALTRRDYAEMAAEHCRILSRDVPGSFDEVTAAYDRGELTRDQYRTLAHAVAEAINAEARREAE